MNDKTPLIDTAIQEQIRKHKARIIIFRLVCASAGIILFLWLISPYMQLKINGTDSIDGTLFLLVKDAEVHKGDIAAFIPPKKNLYPEKLSFGKVVAGVAGDVVSFQGRDLYINGFFMGRAKETAFTGDKLQLSDPGVIPPGYFFMWTAKEDSYDSRYKSIGWIHESHVLGRLHRIF
ncbi:S26 family signal peptidase [Algicola sagamiensis]|uniref:S26 family signal peptidase n=1 Tax=Algicola sagamiensis TaxID=163869 RepID=UPI00037795E6|nr:S26 family signal peptidase [Algicola sagamiensis]